MYCPVCKDTTLVMSERQGIEIDYCPQCRGVWLDRGELDKIIQHSLRDLGGASQSAAMAPPPRQEHGYAPPRQEQPGYPPRHEDNRHYHDDRRHYKKKKSFWEELFD